MADTNTEKKNDLPWDALNELASHVYDISKSKGFHSSSEPKMGDFVSNLHGEVSELWEAYRRSKLFEQCDKDTPLTCIEEELADIIIRALDTAKTYNVDIGKALRLKSAYNETRSYRNGGKIA
jgi:NTP pyrophosphatase (non-canonical NTP hydrolase)